MNTASIALILIVLAIVFVLKDKIIKKGRTIASKYVDQSDNNFLCTYTSPFSIITLPPKYTVYDLSMENNQHVTCMDKECPSYLYMVLGDYHSCLVHKFNTSEEGERSKERTHRRKRRGYRFGRDLRKPPFQSLAEYNIIQSQQRNFIVYTMRRVSSHWESPR